MKLVFLGPPGAGKGTQAERICKRFGTVHISTGDMLRHEMEMQTPLGKIAAELINDGHLVPDEVVFRMVCERIEKAEHGFLLDGFPRTLSQAHMLATVTDIDFAVNIDVPKDRLINRIVRRRSCPECETVYDLGELPNGEFCKKCGRKLVIRKDDTPETAQERFRVYAERTMPIIRYYEAEGKLLNINGDCSKDDVEKQILAGFGEDMV
ncbi:MAG: adenylate kinase [Clostridia bacterium]|nr:adenylate kinase [Clostridia bacterium]